MRGLAAFVLAAVLTLAGSLSLAAMPMSKGPALQPGATIGIVAPATHSEGIDLAPGIQALQHLGYRVQLAPHALAQTGYFAGTDADRPVTSTTFFAMTGFRLSSVSMAAMAVPASWTSWITP